MARAPRAEKPGNRGKTDKSGAHRAAFDAAAALEALKWAKGGVQVELPGLGPRRFVGVEALPDDAEPRGAGRPLGAKNLVPQAFREYLAVTYGSPVEGMVQFAARPVVSIVAELVEAHRTICEALGISQTLTPAQVLALVQMVPSLKLTAQRYAAPYTATQAPQPQPAAAAVQRIAVAMFTNGTPPPEQMRAAGQSLAAMLGIEENQQVIDVEPVELNVGQLNAEAGDDA
jgi:hypothetical protein